ncbi:hypothetical protein NSQ29_01830 [Paenibacillus sp. FSL F4-0236]|uniref:hypothetical protein n=1 Tax=Paenibacillus sp. FSL F4-0236 TaxID=2954731 RepID=UPI0030FA3010
MTDTFDILNGKSQESSDSPFYWRIAALRFGHLQLASVDYGLVKAKSTSSTTEEVKRKL